jgi:hypothetical protein
MTETGYAVFVTDAVTDKPVAIFAYPDSARYYADNYYPARSRVEPFSWQRVGTVPGPDPPAPRDPGPPRDFAISASVGKVVVAFGGRGFGVRVELSPAAAARLAGELGRAAAEVSDA